MNIGASGIVDIKNCSDLEAGIDIYEGASQQTGFGGSAGTPPFRIFGPNGVVIFQVGTLGGVNTSGASIAVVTKTTTYTAVGSDGLILADATAGAFTITLPPANISAPFGKQITVIKIDSTANSVTISRAGTDHILTAAITSVALESQYASISLTANGSSLWYPSSADFAAPNNQLTTVTTTYTIKYSDYKILADATAGAFTATLPAANSVPPGWEVRIEKIDSGGNAVTVSRAGADTIEGATTVALSAQYNTSRFTSDGVSIWYHI